MESLAAAVADDDDADDGCTGLLAAGCAGPAGYEEHASEPAHRMSSTALVDGMKGRSMRVADVYIGVAGSRDHAGAGYAGLRATAARG